MVKFENGTKADAFLASLEAARNDAKNVLAEKREEAKAKKEAGIVRLPAFVSAKA